MIDWQSAGMTWAEAYQAFNGQRDRELAKGWTGLDTTLVLSIDAGDWFKAAGAIPGLVTLALGPLLDGARSAVTSFAESGAVIGVHWGGETDKFGAAILAVPSSYLVYYAEQGEDHLLDPDGGVLLGTRKWVEEDLCHKIGYGLGIWPSRTRY